MHIFFVYLPICLVVSLNLSLCVSLCLSIYLSVYHLLVYQSSCLCTYLLGTGPFVTTKSILMSSKTFAIIAFKNDLNRRRHYYYYYYYYYQVRYHTTFFRNRLSRKLRLRFYMTDDDNAIGRDN